MVEIWADCPFYYHVMSAELKGRDRRQLAMEDISKSGYNAGNLNMLSSALSVCGDYLKLRVSQQPRE